jgi:DNA-binding MarR family transcriptional regulator
VFKSLFLLNKILFLCFTKHHELEIILKFIILAYSLLLCGKTTKSMTNPEEKAYFIKIDITIKKLRIDIQKQLNKSGFDITVDQWVVLENISQKQGISQNELAEVTAKDAPTITRILDLMQKKGIVSKKLFKNDARKYGIYLTAFGEELHKKVRPIVLEVRKKGWGNLSDEDYNTLVRIMDSIYSNIK